MTTARSVRQFQAATLRILGADETDLSGEERAACLAGAAALERLNQTCDTCAHADIESAGGRESGACWCAAPAAWTYPATYPFRTKLMPLDERCKGWTAREGDDGA